RQFHCRLQNQRCNWIQVIRDCARTKTHRLERDAPTAGCRVQNGAPYWERLGKMLESAGVSIGVCAESFTGCCRGRNSHLRSHRIAVNAEIVQEPSSV